MDKRFVPGIPSNPGVNQLKVNHKQETRHGCKSKQRNPYPY